MALKVGIAGLGFYYGPMWTKVFSRCSKTDVTVTCDLRTEKAEAIAEQVGAKTVTSSLDELLATDVDLIGLFTPGPLHVKHAIAAMEAGKHVLSAVPTAWTLDECQDLIDAVERTGMKYMLAETPTYDSWVSHVNRMYAAGEMGEVFYVQLTGLQDLSSPMMGTDYFSQENVPDGMHSGQKHTWRYGLPPFKYIEHSTGPVMTALGQDITEVTAYGWGCNPDDYESKYGMQWKEVHGNPFTFEAGLFRLSNGAVLKISIGWVGAAGTGGGWNFELWGTKKSYLVGDEKNLEITREESNEVAVPEQPRILEPDLQEFAAAENSPYIIQDFADAILNDTPPPIDVYKAVAFTVPGLCAHQSALEGKTVKVPQFRRKK